MTARTVEAQQRTAGIGRPHSPPDPVILQLLDERLTVEALIRRTVEEQVRDLALRPTLDTWTARQTLDAWYPAPVDTAAQRTADVVQAPANPKPDVLRFFSTAGAGPLDTATEMARALHAFEAGTFLVLVGGRQVERLGEMVTFAPHCTVTFLRLTPLVGG